MDREWTIVTTATLVALLLFFSSAFAVVADKPQHAIAIAILALVVIQAIRP